MHELPIIYQNYDLYEINIGHIGNFIKDYSEMAVFIAMSISIM